MRYSQLRAFGPAFLTILILVICLVPRSHGQECLCWDWSSGWQASTVAVTVKVHNSQWMPPGTYEISTLTGDATAHSMNIGVANDGFVHQGPIVFGTFADIGGVEVQGEDIKFCRMEDL